MTAVTNIATVASQVGHRLPSRLSSKASLTQDNHGCPKPPISRPSLAEQSPPLNPQSEEASFVNAGSISNLSSIFTGPKVPEARSPVLSPSQILPTAAFDALAVQHVPSVQQTADDMHVAAAGANTVKQGRAMLMHAALQHESFSVMRKPDDSLHKLAAERLLERLGETSKVLTPKPEDEEELATSKLRSRRMSKSRRLSMLMDSGRHSPSSPGLSKRVELEDGLFKSKRHLRRNADEDPESLLDFEESHPVVKAASARSFLVKRFPSVVMPASPSASQLAAGSQDADHFHLPVVTNLMLNQGGVFASGRQQLPRDPSVSTNVSLPATASANLLQTDSSVVQGGNLLKARWELTDRHSIDSSAPSTSQNALPALSRGNSIKQPPQLPVDDEHRNTQLHLYEALLATIPPALQWQKAVHAWQVSNKKQ